MFEKFSDSARRVLFYARYEAGQAGSPQIATEHLLLGLLRGKDSTAGAILQEHGVQLYEVREHVVAILRKRAVADGQEPGAESPGGAVDRACRGLEGLTKGQRLAVLTRLVFELEEPLDAVPALDAAFEARIRREQPGLGVAEPLEQCWAAVFQRVLRLRRGEQGCGGASGRPAASPASRQADGRSKDSKDPGGRRWPPAQRS